MINQVKKITAKSYNKIIQRIIKINNLHVTVAQNKNKIKEIREVYLKKDQDLMIAMKKEGMPRIIENRKIIDLLP